MSVSVSFDASQLEELADVFGMVPEKSRSLAKLAVGKSGSDLERLGKINAPVDKGDLQNSIGSDYSSDGMRVEVGPTVHYGRYVEEGTRRMQGRRYLGRALDVVGPNFEAAIGKIAEITA